MGGEIADSREGVYAAGWAEYDMDPSYYAAEDYIERVAEYDEIDGEMGDPDDAISSVVWRRVKTGEATDPRTDLWMAAPRPNVPTRFVRFAFREMIEPDDDGRRIPQQDRPTMTAQRIQEFIRLRSQVEVTVDSVEAMPDIIVLSEISFYKVVAHVQCASLQDAATVFVRNSDCFWNYDGAPELHPEWHPERMSASWRVNVKFV